jgi:hypothetical protein
VFRDDIPARRGALESLIIPLDLPRPAAGTMN